MTGFMIEGNEEPTGTPTNKTEEARAKLIEAMGGEQAAAPTDKLPQRPDVTDEEAIAAVEGTAPRKKAQGTPVPTGEEIGFEAAFKRKLAERPDIPPQNDTDTNKAKKKKTKNSTLDDLINDKDKKYRRFVLHVYNAYGHSIEYPDAQENQQFESALKSVLAIFSGRPTLNPLSRTMVVSQDGVKEFTANKKQVMLEKGRTLNSDKAFAMALVLSMNPKAYARGVTLHGSDQDKALLQDALMKVMALHPSRAPIVIHNPVGGQQPLPAMAPEAVTQAQPAVQPAKHSVSPQPTPTDSMPLESLDFTLEPTLGDISSSAVQAQDSLPTPALVDVKPVVVTPAAAAESHSDVIKSAFDSARGKKWEPTPAAIELAKEHILKTGEADIEGLKNKFNIGDTKARRLMTALAQEGLVERESDHKTAPWQIRRAKANSAPEAYA
jgi:hypothetical protein